MILKSSMATRGLEGHGVGIVLIEMDKGCVVLGRSIVAVGVELKDGGPGIFGRKENGGSGG